MLTQEQQDAIAWLRDCSHGNRRGKKEIQNIKIVLALLDKFIDYWIKINGPEIPKAAYITSYTTEKKDK